MTETKPTIIDGIADDQVLRRFAKYVERLESVPDASTTLFDQFASPAAARAYAAFVLYVSDTAEYSDLIHKFADRYIGSYDSWDTACEELHQLARVDESITETDLKELRGIPILELPGWAEAEIRRRIQHDYWVISTTSGTLYVFYRAD